MSAYSKKKFSDLEEITLDDVMDEYHPTVTSKSTDIRVPNSSAADANESNTVFFHDLPEFPHLEESSALFELIKAADARAFLDGSSHGEITTANTSESSHYTMDMEGFLANNSTLLSDLQYCEQILAPQLGEPAHTEAQNDPSNASIPKVVRCCSYPGCSKFPQSSTPFCISHGGGRRCTYPDCSKAARDRLLCAAHGGGKRCTAENCLKSAVGGSLMCSLHGGGKKCAFDGCQKAAQSPTSFCVQHGGGKRCNFKNCLKVARGKTPFCSAHGGGPRCEVEGCGRAAIAKTKSCRFHMASASPTPEELPSSL